MEIFDVVNKNDEVVGTATRDECHSDSSLIHRAVHFTLVDINRKKILLTQRSFKKETDPGKLTFLGEHLTAGENYEKAILRGVKEEAKFTPENVNEVGKHMFELHNQTEFIRFFVVEWEGEKLSFDKDEIVKFEWLTPQELIKRRSDYSEMTRYWVENINWESVFSEK